MIVVPATTDPTPIVAPTKDDGDLYEFQMFFGSNCVFADTHTELCAFVIPGYGDIPDTDEGADAALVQRYLFARSISAVTQGSVNAQAAESGALGLLDQAQIDALFSDKSVPFDVTRWENGEFVCPVPLFLIDADYQPYSDREAPTGAIEWIRVYDELDFVLSLNELGVVRYAFRRPETVAI